MQLWLRETKPDRTVRNETILRLFMLWLLDSTDAVAFFDDELDSHRRRLAGFEQTLADDERQRREHGTAPRRHGVLRRTRARVGHRGTSAEYIGWASEARDRIAGGAEGWDDARERLLETADAGASR